MPGPVLTSWSVSSADVSRVGDWNTAGSSLVALRRFVQGASLDVAIGVACAATFAVSATGSRPPLSWWLLLPTVTWVIYSADHLLDVAGSPGRSPDPRRGFHRDHARPTAALAIAGACAAVGLAIASLPRPALIAGGVIAIASVLHLFAARRGVTRTKELSAAAIYTAGIWFLPVMQAQAGHGWIAAMIVLHFTAAWLNLVAFADFELAADERESHPSIVRVWGRRRTGFIVGGVGAVGLIAGIALAVPAAAPLRLHFLLLALLICVPPLMLSLRTHFCGSDRYRTAGDLAFLAMVLPGLFR